MTAAEGSRDLLPAAGTGVERLELPGAAALVQARHRPVTPEELARVLDPAEAEETLHWGRNYLYVARLARPGGPLPVVVKQFRNEGLSARLRRRLLGSKAKRSWVMSRALEEAGIPTPEAVALVEAERPDGPSFFLSALVEDALEVRYVLRAANAGTAREEFPRIDVEELLVSAGRLVRRMHDAGIWHRDLSIGNVLVRPAPEGPELFLVDLNRARRRSRLGVFPRTRDLSRLAIFRVVHQRLFFRAYWEDRLRGQRLKWLLYRLLHRDFLTRIELKGRLRGVLAKLRSWLIPRSTHVHIPPAPEGARRRDRTVWDPLSDQPHQHAGRLDRLLVRAADARAHARGVGAIVLSAPRVWRRYRRLAAELHSRPRPWSGVGVALRPDEEDPERPLRLLEELGVSRALLRLHPWAPEHRAEEELARELAARGVDLAFALPQNRELVRDPKRWGEAVERLGEAFAPYGGDFQVGQAINRSKWGVWTYEEYLELAAVASQGLRRHPGVRILGPAVIDFELHATLAVLNMGRTRVHFDVVTSLLYVDRRGAPENPQVGLDTVGKTVLLKAIAETSRHAEGECWITEVNWPLWEGPHSPAGRSVAVDEETQASYLVRYYLLCLGAGMVERVYWWQLRARGYGLVDPSGEGGARRRSSFRALATMVDRLRGSTFVAPLPVPAPARLYHFTDRAGETLVVGWSAAAPQEAELPAPPRRMVSRDGEELPPPEGPRMRLTGSPVYCYLPGGSIP